MFAKRKAEKRDLLKKRWTPQNDTIQNTTCILDNDVTQCVLSSYFLPQTFLTCYWITGAHTSSTGT